MAEIRHLTFESIHNRQEISRRSKGDNHCLIESFLTLSLI